MSMPFKIPCSVLVVIHTRALDVLLIQRADFSTAKGRSGPSDEFWQSVTGSQDFEAEPLAVTAAREIAEETGIVCPGQPGQGGQLVNWHLSNVYDIYPRWRHRYAPGVTRNTEHLFSLEVPVDVSITLNPREHLAFQWLPWRQAAELCYSPSNAEAILMLPRFVNPIN